MQLLNETSVERSTVNLWSCLMEDFRCGLDSHHRVLIRTGENSAFVPGGNNGPHHALESAVRNTAHWITALCIGYKIFRNRSYLDSCSAMTHWLLSDNNFFKDNAFLMRQKSGQDSVNGVIGPAWIIEALSRSASILGNEQAGNLANDLAKKLKYVPNAGAWQRHDPFSRRQSVDYTFDHQAWLAAAIADIGLFSNVKGFLDHLANGGFKVNAQGRIHHILCAKTLKGRALDARYRYWTNWRNSGRSEELEDGYHIYSLMPLARLFVRFTEHHFFRTKDFHKALEYVSVELIDKMRTNRFGFAYNLPGIELPLIYAAFNDRLSISAGDIIATRDMQAAVTRDSATGLHLQNNPDPLTLASRIYELGLALEIISKK